MTIPEYDECDCGIRGPHEKCHQPIYLKKVGDWWIVFEGEKKMESFNIYAEDYARTEAGKAAGKLKETRIKEKEGTHCG